jgi:hypothetical protein
MGTPGRYGSTSGKPGGGGRLLASVDSTLAGGTENSGDGDRVVAVGFARDPGGGIAGGLGAAGGAAPSSGGSGNPALGSACAVTLAKLVIRPVNNQRLRHRPNTTPG